MTHTCPFPDSRNSKPKGNSCLPFYHSQRTPTRLQSSWLVESLSSQEVLADITALRLERYASQQKCNEVGQWERTSPRHGQFLAIVTGLHNPPGRTKQTQQLTLSAPMSKYTEKVCAQISEGCVLAPDVWILGTCPCGTCFNLLPLAVPGRKGKEPFVSHCQ